MPKTTQPSAPKAVSNTPNETSVPKKATKTRKTAAAKKVAAAKTPATSAKSAKSGAPESPSQTVSRAIRTMLELHIQHELDACDPATLVDWLRPNAQVIFDWIKTVPLSDLVDKEDIKSVIRRNVVDAEIPEAIAELTSESAARILNSDHHENTAVGDILTDTRFERLVDKQLIFNEQCKNVLYSIIDLPIYGDLISGVVYEAIVRYIYESNVLTNKIPGVSSMLKMGRKVVNKTAPKLGGVVEENVRSYIAANLKFILKESKSFLDESLTDEQLKNSAMTLWGIVEDKTLEELQEGVKSDEIVELIMLGYDAGLSFGKTPYFIGSFELIVDCFFDKYGDDDLGALMDDLEITPERIMGEIEIFAPRIIQACKQSGELEALLRRRLEDFYSSDSVLAFFKENM